jgi:hypothetical protein
MANQIIKETIIEVVETQIKTGDPAIVRETLERLLNSGHTRDDAILLIGSALLEEMHAVLKSQQPYDEARYRQALEKLS